jgi:hypothetical protein
MLVRASDGLPTDLPRSGRAGTALAGDDPPPGLSRGKSQASEHPISPIPCEAAVA